MAETKKIISPDQERELKEKIFSGRKVEELKPDQVKKIVEALGKKDTSFLDSFHEIQVIVSPKSDLEDNEKGNFEEQIRRIIFEAIQNRKEVIEKKLAKLDEKLEKEKKRIKADYADRIDAEIAEELQRVQSTKKLDVAQRSLERKKVTAVLKEEQKKDIKALEKKFSKKRAAYEALLDFLENPPAFEETSEKTETTEVPEQAETVQNKLFDLNAIREAEDVQKMKEMAKKVTNRFGTHPQKTDRDLFIQEENGEKRKLSPEQVDKYKKFIEALERQEDTLKNIVDKMNGLIPELNQLGRINTNPKIKEYAEEKVQSILNPILDETLLEKIPDSSSEARESLLCNFLEVNNLTDALKKLSTLLQSNVDPNTHFELSKRKRDASGETIFDIVARNGKDTKTVSPASEQPTPSTQEDETPSQKQEILDASSYGLNSPSTRPWIGVEIKNDQRGIPHYEPGEVASLEAQKIRRAATSSTQAGSGTQEQPAEPQSPASVEAASPAAESGTAKVAEATTSPTSPETTPPVSQPSIPDVPDLDATSAPSTPRQAPPPRTPETLNIVMVNVDEKIKRIARALARERLDQELKELGVSSVREFFSIKGLKKSARKFWMRNGYEGYMQHYEQEYEKRLRGDGHFRTELMRLNRDQLRDAPSTWQEVKANPDQTTIPAESERRQLNGELDAIAERFGVSFNTQDSSFLSEGEQLQEITRDSNGRAHAEIFDLCKQYVDESRNPPMSDDEFRIKMRNIAKLLSDDTNDQEIATFLESTDGSNNGLLDKLKAHKAGMIMLDLDNIRLHLGTAKNVDVGTDVKNLTLADKAANWLVSKVQKRPILGKIMSVPTVAIAGYAVANITSAVVTSRAVKILAVPTAFTLSGPVLAVAATGLVSGVLGSARNNVELLRLKAQAERRSSTTQPSIGTNNSMEQKMQSTLYEKVPVNELINRMRNAETADLAEMIDTLAEAIARVNISAGIKETDGQSINLIQYANETDIEKQRMALLRKIAEAKIKLQARLQAGTSIDSLLSKAVAEQQKKLLEKTTDSEKKFRTLRLKDNLKAFAYGAVISTAITGALYGITSGATSLTKNPVNEQGLREALRHQGNLTDREIAGLRFENGIPTVKTSEFLASKGINVTSEVGTTAPGSISSEVGLKSQAETLEWLRGKGIQDPENLFDGSGKLTQAGAADLKNKGITLHLETIAGTPENRNLIAEGFKTLKGIHFTTEPHTMQALRIAAEGATNGDYTFDIHDLHDKAVQFQAAGTDTIIPGVQNFKMGVQVNENGNFYWKFFDADANGKVQIPPEYFDQNFDRVPKGGDTLPGLKTDALAAGFIDSQGHFQVLASVKGDGSYGGAAAVQEIKYKIVETRTVPGSSTSPTYRATYENPEMAVIPPFFAGPMRHLDKLRGVRSTQPPAPAQPNAQQNQGNPPAAPSAQASASNAPNAAPQTGTSTPRAGSNAPAPRAGYAPAAPSPQASAPSGVSNAPNSSTAAPATPTGSPVAEVLGSQTGVPSETEEEKRERELQEIILANYLESDEGCFQRNENARKDLLAGIYTELQSENFPQKASELFKKIPENLRRELIQKIPENIYADNHTDVSRFIVGYYFQNKQKFPQIEEEAAFTEIFNALKTLFSLDDLELPRVPKGYNNRLKDKSVEMVQQVAGTGSTELVLRITGEQGDVPGKIKDFLWMRGGILDPEEIDTLKFDQDGNPDSKTAQFLANHNIKLIVQPAEKSSTAAANAPTPPAQPVPSPAPQPSPEQASAVAAQPAPSSTPQKPSEHAPAAASPAPAGTPEATPPTAEVLGSTAGTPETKNALPPLRRGMTEDEINKYLEAIPQQFAANYQNFGLSEGFVKRLIQKRFRREELLQADQNELNANPRATEIKKQIIEDLATLTLSSIKCKQLLSEFAQNGYVGPYRVDQFNRILTLLQRVGNWNVMKYTDSSQVEKIVFVPTNISDVEIKRIEAEKGIRLNRTKIKLSNPNAPVSPPAQPEQSPQPSPEQAPAAVAPSPVPQKPPEQASSAPEATPPSPAPKGQRIAKVAGAQPVAPTEIDSGSRKVGPTVIDVQGEATAEIEEDFERELEDRTEQFLISHNLSTERLIDKVAVIKVYYRDRQPITPEHIFNEIEGFYGIYAKVIHKNLNLITEGGLFEQIKAKMPQKLVNTYSINFPNRLKLIAILYQRFKKSDDRDVQQREQLFLAIEDMLRMVSTLDEGKKLQELGIKL